MPRWMIFQRRVQLPNSHSSGLHDPVVGTGPGHHRYMYLNTHEDLSCYGVVREGAEDIRLKLTGDESYLTSGSMDSYCCLESRRFLSPS